MCIFIHYACLFHRHQRRRLIQSIEFIASGNLPVILILLFQCSPFQAFYIVSSMAMEAIEGNRERINTLLCILLMTVNLL